MSFPACPICVGPSGPGFVSGSYRMYACSTCRSAFVAPTPSDATLAEFYSNYHLSDDSGGMYDVLEARMQADFPHKVAMVKNLLPAPRNGKPGTILDVGCGKGYFVKACVDAGLDAQGCDLSDTGVRFARERLSIRATQGLISDLKETLGQFDVVTFWATIEHLPDPVGTLLDIASVIKPGGRLLMDTGIGADWLDRLLPGRNQWYDPPQHLFVFSGPGLRAAAERAGFIVESHDHNYTRSRRRAVLKTIRNAVLAGGLRAAATLGRMHLDGFIATRYPVGNVQLMVARKPG
ncbi:hypothetical protein BH11PLA1_BH11PLA1_17620 [soil metagenome]